MLRIAKLTPGSERYYFATVRSSTDRPGGLIEPDPIWLGSGSEALALDGTPGTEAVRRLLCGRDPLSGDLLAERRGVGGFDLTFSVPKSLSILHGLGSDETAATVRRAHVEAVAATLGHLERELLWVRRRRGEDSWQIRTDGAVAVGFVHRTSRANDPHLHTHVVVANLAHGEDGRWGALDARVIYQAQRELRALFESHLRARLSRSGVEFGPIRKDFADVVSIPREMVTEFSRQSAVIASSMRSEGLRGPAAAALVAENVRPDKDRSRTYEAMQAEWRERGYAVGISKSRLERAAGAGRARPAPHRAQEAPQPWLEGASAKEATFTRSDLIVACCSSSSEGASVGEVERAVAAVIPALLRDERTGRYTTREHLERTAALAERLAALAESAGAEVLSYERGGRFEALDRLSRLSLSDDALVALAPGRHAARRFESCTGIESFALRDVSSFDDLLAGREKLVAVEAAAWSLEELTVTLAACQQQARRPILFGSLPSFEKSALLSATATTVPRLRDEPLRNIEVGERLRLGPGLSARAAGSLRTACELAAAEAAASRGRTVLVAPDRAVAAVLRGHGYLDVVDSSDRQARAQAAAFPRLVVLGRVDSARGAPSPFRQLRSHLVVGPVPGDICRELGRLGEAARPPHLVNLLGPPPHTPGARESWRLRAGVSEERRLEKGLEREHEARTARARSFAPRLGAELDHVRGVALSSRRERGAPCRERGGLFRA